MDPNHKAIVYGNLCISSLRSSCKTSVLLIVFLDANVEARSTGTKMPGLRKSKRGHSLQNGDDKAKFKNLDQGLNPRSLGWFPFQ